MKNTTEMNLRQREKMLSYDHHDGETLGCGGVRMKFVILLYKIFFYFVSAVKLVHLPYLYLFNIWEDQEMFFTKFFN